VTKASSYKLGSHTPSRIEEPADASAVAALLASVAAERAAAVAFGGGTLQAVGNAPSRYDIALSLRRLNHVLDYDHRDLTIGLDAGMTIEAVNATLGKFGQFIPFDVPQPRTATVGGTLAAGWTGPRSATYGRLRDVLIGSTVALPDGTLACAGGMVVKNVTGYDMSKLYVGSLGTLGVIVRANFKAQPRAANRRLALAPLPDDVRERAIAAVANLAIEPTAALVVEGFFRAVARVRDEDARMIVLFEGSPAVIDRATRDLRSALGAAGVAETSLFDEHPAEKHLQDVLDAYIDPVEDRSVTFRSTGLASNAWTRAAVFHAVAHENASRCDTIVDIRGGVVIARFEGRTHAALAEVLTRIATGVRRVIPQASVLAGDARLRAAIDAWGVAPSTIATMRELKARFDPDALLAPGRYVGGI
jgi:glycolate oxidase FAD binding subunit